MRTYFLIILFFIAPIFLIGQESDQTFEKESDKNWEAKLKDLGLDDISTNKEGNIYRFFFSRQVVELADYNDSLSLFLINYTYWKKKLKNDDNKFIKERLSFQKEDAIWLKNLIESNRIYEMPVQDSIKGWFSSYLFGHVHEFEFSVDEEYARRTYNNVSVYDSIPEAVIIQNFIDSLKDKLKLEEKDQKFIDKLPYKGCYDRGVKGKKCHSNYAKEYGLVGSSKLPFGIAFATGKLYSGTKRLSLYTKLNYRTDFKGNSDFRVRLSRAQVFNEFDNIVTYYRRRRLNFLNEGNPFQNYQFIYARYSELVKVHTGVGLDYLDYKKKELGLRTYINRRNLYKKISLTARASIFREHVDYRFTFAKPIRVKIKESRTRLHLTTGVEKFKSFYDINWGITLNL